MMYGRPPALPGRPASGIRLVWRGGHRTMDQGAAAIMARPKKGQGVKSKGGRPRVESPKRNVVTLRGSEEWRDWLNELADHCGLPTTVLIAQAVKDYAKAEGFGKPMPRR